MSEQAPGAPGISPRWTSSAKSGVGTALSSLSRVWFTLSHGILNEVYYPRVDQACTRDFGLIVTDEGGFLSEEKRDAEHAVEWVESGVPAFILTNSCVSGRYRIRKSVVADHERDVVLQKISFTALKPAQGRYRIFGLLAPHLVNAGSHNTAWLGEYKGVPMLFAQGSGVTMALASDKPFGARSVGFVGNSDGWQDLHNHGRLMTTYSRADDGNVALTVELCPDTLSTPEGEVVLALAFGSNWAEAAFRARASLQDGFDNAQAGFAKNWRQWQKTLTRLDRPRKDNVVEPYRVSTSVLRCHESPSFPGGLIASLSIPWGAEKGDDNLGGYHLVWPRDLAETAGGMLAAGATAEARRVMDYFQATQEADGHWPQNTWLDGTAYWQGVQMDECAFPLLVLDLAIREEALPGAVITRYWSMVSAAASFIVRNGPATAQDRWEEDAGYSPFTLAVEIVALLIAADFADHVKQTEMAKVLRDTADAWYEEIDHWTYSNGGALAEKAGVDGYYVRIAPLATASAASPIAGYVPIKNRPPEDASQPAIAVVSPDALALVRFGLRDANDPRMVNTVKVIDQLLRVELPDGPCWRRYNGDGYGEHEDGSAFDGTGIGRAWPLLAGERAHFELAAGRPEEAEKLLETIEKLIVRGGMIPEQLWDKADIPERELWLGKPTGSAMPLVWAHAEHIKLRRSLADGRVFDLPPQTVKRYLTDKQRSLTKLWRMNSRASILPSGKKLRIELTEASMVHWSSDHWVTIHDSDTSDCGLGLHVVELPVESLKAGDVLIFTLRQIATGAWAGEDFTISVV